MANELAVRYEVDGNEITLNPNIVLKYMIDDRTLGNISQKEMAKVIMTCQARQLNPFTGDVIVQPRKNKDGSVTCSLVATKDFYLRRASTNPRMKGITAGITVISSDGRPVKRKGSAVYSQLGEVLAGGWAEVKVDGYEDPVYAEVSLNEYNQGFALWKSKPATMIRKVAVSQALREAFPNAFTGTYEPEEIGYEAPSEGVSFECERDEKVSYEEPPQIFDEPDRVDRFISECVEQAKQWGQDEGEWSSF